jgi:flagellar biogenesis protein FliO
MQALTFFFAFVAVLALIGVAAWLVRRFAGNRIGANPNRGRMPRLAVIDAAAVDNRRRLVLVRRDNIEHLLMIGGPTDIVVEANIVRATTARDQIPQRNGGGAEPPPRITPLPEAAIWTDGDPLDLPEPQMPEPPPRPVRAAFGDEVRRPAERRDPLTGFAPEQLTARPQPMPSRPRNEPAMTRVPRPVEQPKAPGRAPEPAAAAAPPAPSLSTADQNLAEMAQRLEAALRRPGVEAGEPRVGAPPVAPEPPPGRGPRNEPSAPPQAAASKSGFENLEDEMASLLGRPKSPS